MTKVPPVIVVPLNDEQKTVRLQIKNPAMTRHQKIQSPEEDEPGLNISSLIDVCFLLLIYFLVTTQIVQKEQELSNALPSIQPEFSLAEIAPLSLLLEANGRIFIQEESGLLELIESNLDARDLSQLSARLKLYRSSAEISQQAALVKISVEPETVQQRVTDVLNALTGADITEITFTD